MPHLSLPARVLLGAVLGIGAGAALPDFAGYLAPIGSAYVMLLQIVVYPYVVCSLIHGLGRLDKATSKRFFRKAGPFFLLTWAITYATIFALTPALPEARVVVVDYTVGSTSTTEDFLKLLIPANVFADLGNNIVPAVVIFALLFGFAIQSHPRKDSLLALLEVLKAASVTIWNWCVLLSPLAIFAMLASTVASVSGTDLDQMALYVLLFTLGTLTVAFWTLPWIVSAFIPLPPGRLVKEMREALVIAAVTTLSVAALPMIGRTVKKLCDELGLEDERRDEIAETALAVAYPLGQLGNFFVYLFLLFAATYYHQPVTGAQAVLLPEVTLLSCVGSPSSTVNAVDFLSGWLEFPQGATSLYVQTMVVTRYGQVLVSVMAFITLTLLPVFSYYGRLRIRRGSLAAALLVPLVLIAMVSWGLGSLEQRLVPKRPAPWMSLTLDPELVARVKARVEKTMQPAPPERERLSTLDRVKSSGVLRVGYSPTVIPFCYWNQAGELVGYDVAMAYRLASDLGVALELVPFEWDNLKMDLVNHRFDVAMAGVYVTPDRLRDLDMTTPYFHSPWALIVRTQDAARFPSIEQLRGVSFTVFKDKIMLDFLNAMFPGSQHTVVDDYSKLLTMESPGPALWTLRQARAFAAANLGFTAVRPQGLAGPVLFTYATSKDSELSLFLNYWMQQKELEGFSQRQRDYWLEGKARSTVPGTD